MIGVGHITLALLSVGLVAAGAAFLRSRTAKTVDGEVVPADISALATDAGVTPDVYALARVAASEAGGQRRIAKQGVCWVVVNEANRGRVSPFEVVLGAAQAFGPQGTGGRNFVASGKDPLPVDLEIAAGVIDGSLSDPTGGAVNFDSPGAYKDKTDDDGNVVQTAEQRAATFAANREREGKTLVLLDGVPEKTFRFWGRA